MPFRVMVYTMVVAAGFFLYVILLCAYRDRKQARSLRAQVYRGTSRPR